MSSWLPNDVVPVITRRLQREMLNKKDLVKDR